jgi:hypothetical protein
MSSTNGYPFASRRMVIARIASDPAFAIDCVKMLDARRAWMASHRPAAAKLVARLDAGPANAELACEAARLVGRYSKTLARILRERDLAERPELTTVGAVFGVARVAAPVTPAGLPVAVAPAVVPPEAAPVVVPNAPPSEPPPSEEPGSEPAPPPKRRGRPKGSRNRPRTADEPKPTRRRRG